METKTDILDELRSLSPLISEMKKVNVFAIPEGYFDSIPATVLACLNEEDHPTNFLKEQLLTDVPEGYFAQLADSILNKIKLTETASDETRNLSPMLYDLNKKHLFDVPEIYFGQLADAVFNKIKGNQSASEEIQELSSLLYGLQNKSVFKTPAGYFEGFENAVVDKLNTVGVKEALKEISPILYDIQNKIVFEVPDRYFETLSDNILNKINPTIGKVVSMPKRNLFFKYAVAAMLTGVTALGIYKYVEKPGGTTITANNALAMDVSIEKGKSMNDIQFNEALDGLNDADIAKYLENNGDITDVAVLDNSLDESKLPSQDDYLTDETTLDNFLKEIEKPAVNN